MKNVDGTDPDVLCASVRAGDAEITVPKVLARGVPDEGLPSDHLPVVQDFRFN